MPENSSARPNQLIPIAVLVIALAAVFFVGRSLGDDSNDNNDNANAASTTETFGVVTSGEASVKGTPDQLTFTATVRNTKATNAEAMGHTNHDVRAVIIAAKAKGVAKKDIQTQDISIRGTYSYRGGRHLTGYAAVETVKIMVRKLDDAGKIIGAVTAAGGNAVSINGISLSISNKDVLIAQARTNAVKKSKAAAAALAKAAGRDVGDLEYVEEVAAQPNYFNRADYDYGDQLMASVRGVAASVPITPGKQQVSVTVKVRWSLAH
jgi:hypothetical protein